MALESLKIAKIITKTECCKHPKSYCLEVKHLIHFDYHYLLVADKLINFPNVCIQSDGHCSMLHVPCHLLLSFFPFENGVPKCHKNADNLFVKNLRKFRKFTVSSISCFGDIKEV